MTIIYAKTLTKLVAALQSAKTNLILNQNSILKANDKTLGMLHIAKYTGRNEYIYDLKTQKIMECCLCENDNNLKDLEVSL